MTAPHSKDTWEMARSEPDPVMRLRTQPPALPAATCRTRRHGGELPPEACLAVRTSGPGAQVEPPRAPAPGTLAGGQRSAPPHTCGLSSAGRPSTRSSGAPEATQVRATAWFLSVDSGARLWTQVLPPPSLARGLSHGRSLPTPG